MPDNPYLKARYGRGWSRTQKRAMSATFHRCVLNPLHRAESVHHAYYSLSTLNREPVGWQVFPLCPKCHKGIAHHKRNWIDIANQKQAVWSERNRYPFLWYLRFRFAVWLVTTHFVFPATLTLLTLWLTRLIIN